MSHLERKGHLTRHHTPEEVESLRHGCQTAANNCVGAPGEQTFKSQHTKTKDKYRGYRLPGFDEHVIGTPQTPEHDDDGKL